MDEIVAEDLEMFSRLLALLVGEKDEGDLALKNGFGALNERPCDLPLSFSGEEPVVLSSASASVELPEK